VPGDVAIVEYWIGNTDAYIWAATREGVVMARAGSATALNDAAREMHTALKGFGSTPVAQRLKLSEHLYDMALAPVEARIAGKRRLLIAPDGALHYIPFATLRASERGQRHFLVEKHDVAVIPSLGMLRNGSARAAPTKQMLLVDDPVYELNDSRLATMTSNKQSTPAPTASRWLTLFRGAEEATNLPRLPGTAQEATTIARLLDPGQVDRLEGFAATRDGFLGLDLGRYRLIHVASHAITDSDVPQASALVLSTFDRSSRQIDGRVLAADFMNVRLNADAVVLSACDTALGRSVAGEGLMGLRYVVLARGAKAVVASLWNAPDAATAQLMSQFYTSLLRSRRSGVAALGESMRSLLHGPFADPSVWGAFTITISTMDET
jgi:CHAT domain-containing protein